MKPTLILSALLFLLLAITPSLKSQELAEKVAIALDSFHTAYPQEKTFLHTDKNSYIAGETIWFKIYVSLENKPTYLSRVVYVSLVNDQGKVIEKNMYPLKDGSTWGDLVLRKELPSGNYTLQCYTLWMLNFPEFIHTKSFYLFNTDYKQPTGSAKPDFSIQFMPEGGDMVTGLSNRIAFKAIGKNGLPVSVKGTVIDSKNKKVADINSEHDGMGMFELTPAPGETYSVSISSEAGHNKSVPLPASRNEGIVLQVVNNNPNRLFVQLQRSETNKAKYNVLLITAQLNNEIIYAGKVNFEEGQQAAAINKKSLAPGIVQLTVFTPEGEPLAERLAFISNYEINPAAVSLDTVSTAARKKNQYSIDLSGYKKPSASVSITNFDADTSLSHPNILSTLYLTSDLKGYVHNPGFYFRNKDAATLQALDLLLMTQGWRRFKWEKILKNEFPPIAHAVESGITVSGTLTTAAGKTIGNGRMDFIIKGEDSTTILSTAQANDKNQFVLPDLDFRKSATVYYQGTKVGKDQALTKVTLYPFFYDTLKSQPVPWRINLDPSTSISSLLQRQLREKASIDQSEGRVLSEVVVKARKLTPADSLNREYASALFFNSDQIIPMDKITYFSIWQFLQRTVPGLTVGKNDVGQTTAFFNRYMNLDPIPSETLDPDLNLDNTTNISFFLNEVPVSKDLIDGLDPSEVALVKVWKGPSAGVLGASNGAIAIYTQKGKSTKDWRDKGFEFFRKLGYSVSRDFYVTDYKLLDDKTSFTDIRETLYWNPSLKTNSDGKAKLVFYNDDVAKKFKVTIQGMDEDGKLINIEKIVSK